MVGGEVCGMVGGWYASGMRLVGSAAYRRFCS